MEANWCGDVFHKAVLILCAPKILNTDKVSHFTSEVYTETVIKETESKLSLYIKA